MNATVQKINDAIKIEPTSRQTREGTQYEWIIPECHVRDLATQMVDWLKSLGCKLCSVDGSREPYYWVQIRFVEEPESGMTYQEHCDWYAVHGDPMRDELESEENARFDDHAERYHDFHRDVY